MNSHSQEQKIYVIDFKNKTLLYQVTLQPGQVLPVAEEAAIFYLAENLREEAYVSMARILSQS
jgi:hypothetical protein